MPSLEEMAQAPQNIELWFTSVCHQIAEARRVIEELSKEDAPTEPFKSKYAGREMLQSALQRAQEFPPSTVQEMARVRVAQAAIFYYIGQVCVDVEEPKDGEKNLQSALDVLALEPVNKYNISLHLHVLNVLATLWSGRGNHDKAYELLEKAKELHANYLHTKEPAPKAYDEVFMDEEFTGEERSVMFEKLYTNTLFYLAQVFGVRGDNKQAAAHCHITLQRQLEAEEFDPLDWSLNCATLSQYYITMNNYVSARHTLACASSVISNVEESSGSGYSDESYDNEKIVKTRADIERCWIKYCVNLLRDSVKELQDKDISDKVSKITEIKNTFEEDADKENEEADKENEEADKKDGKDKKDEEKDVEAGTDDKEDQKDDQEEKKGKTFSDLMDIEDIQLLRITNVETGQYEELVPAELCETYENARRLFKAGSKFVENAAKYYFFEEHVTDHVEIKQDLSSMFLNLSHFEKDESRQCKMHKRRIDILTEMVTPLNMQHFRQLGRTLRFELGEAKNQMVSLKYSLAAEQNPEQQNWRKINNLCLGAITEFDNFANLLKDPSDNFPETLADDTVRPYIVSQIYIARLYGKFRPVDTAQKLAFLARAEEHFAGALRYYDAHGEQCAQLDVKEEVDVAREMLHFLPRKMERIRQTIS